jgi:hypothetical protein
MDCRIAPAATAVIVVACHGDQGSEHHPGERWDHGSGQGHGAEAERHAVEAQHGGTAGSAHVYRGPSGDGAGSRQPSPAAAAQRAATAEGCSGRVKVSTNNESSEGSRSQAALAAMTLAWRSHWVVTKLHD